MHWSASPKGAKHISTHDPSTSHHLSLSQSQWQQIRHIGSNEYLSLVEQLPLIASQLQRLHDVPGAGNDDGNVASVTPWLRHCFEIHVDVNKKAVPPRHHWSGGNQVASTYPLLFITSIKLRFIMASNQAAFLDAKDARLRTGPIELHEAGPDEIVVKNHVLAINPVDWVVQDSGYFVQQWPIVLGSDIAGEVHEVGSNVTRFQKGDRVIAHTIGLTKPELKYGGFQHYSTVLASVTAKVPASISLTDAAVLPLAFDTALIGLSGSIADGIGLGLPYPSLDPSPSGKTLVVWGGSSSVGALAIQLAVAAGVTVIAVASAHNHAFVRRAGATQVFDYNKPDTVVDDVVAAVRAVGGEFAGVFDAISKPPSYQHVLPILEKTGATNLAVVLPKPENAPAYLRISSIFGVNPPLTDDAWRNYITPALEQGKLKPIPEALIVGKGLKSLQKAVDANKKGVSAKKVVVEL
nr:dehydrogenase orse [Quercus suber]